MTNPSPPPTPEGPEEGVAAGAAPGAPGPQERFGPLALQRMHKDDGRLLIVFRETQEGGE